MRDLVICHAPEDRPFVRDLAAFLERGVRLRVNPAEGELRPGESMIEAMERGVAADFAIALLSPDSTAKGWPLKQWTSAFIDEPKRLGVGVACVLLAECQFPPLLRRRHFYTCDADPLETFRALKRWIIAGPDSSPPEPPPDSGLEPLRRDFADKSGIAEAPAAIIGLFASRYKAEFEDVIALGCQRRSYLNLIGEIGSLLGVALDGPFEKDIDAVKAALESRRVLLALEGLHQVGEVTALLGGRCSLLHSVAEAVEPAYPAAVLARLRTWRNDLAGGLEALADAESAFDLAAWPDAAEIGRLTRVIACDQKRIAEASYWIDRLVPLAWSHKDYNLVHECTREQRWIQEGWGNESAAPPAEAAPDTRQLDLFGAATPVPSLFDLLDG